MNVQRIDHTAIVVANLDQAIARYAALLRPGGVHRLQVPDQHVEVAMLTWGDTKIELIQPLDDASGVARFLERRGEGLHHIGLLVDDIRSEMRHLIEEGYELIDREPRPGAHGMIAFIHPRSTGGVLIELVELPP